MIASVWLVGFLAAAAAVQLPDTSKGVMNGRVAVMLWPRGGTTQESPLLQPDNCVAHLVPRSDANKELLFACGVWFQPPADTYRLWLEKDDLVSPSPLMLVYGGGPFRGKGLAAVHDLVPGGRVHLPPNKQLPPNAQVRLLHLQSHLAGPFLGSAFERRVPREKAHLPTLVPAGPIVVSAVDERGEVIAVSRPVQIAAAKTTSVWPEPPKEGTDVVVVFQRPRGHSPAHPDSIQVSLENEQGQRAPDVFVAAADRFFAIWYRVAGRNARLYGTSSTLEIPVQELLLSARPQVKTIRSTLRVLPSLTLSIEGPRALLANEQLNVNLARLNDEVVRHTRVSLEEPHRIEYLPAEELRLALSMGQWTFARDVDLRSGLDTDLTIELTPLQVSGTIYYGSDPAPAKVRFLNGAEWIETASDEQANYSVMLWEPRNYVIEVALRDQPVGPFREFFVPIESSRTLDIRMPKTEYVVRVVDATTNAAVRGARVGATNKYEDESGPRAVSQQILTGDTGEAYLPPLRPGTVALTVSADGYQKADTVTRQVITSNSRHEIPVALRSLGTTTDLHIVLPDGASAVGAELIAVRDGVNILWQGTAPAGVAAIPDAHHGSILIARHSQAATLIRQWDKDAPSTWKFEPLAPPLVVHTVDGSGGRVRFAEVTLWVRNLALRGPALRFATWASPFSNQDGLWMARNLSAGPIQVLASRAGQNPIAALSQTIQYPWPSDVAIRVSP